MEYFIVILLGVVQGITEFAPVSSSGHLVLLHEWLNLNVSSDLAFDVALHAGTLVAIVLFFAKDIIHYIKHSQKLLGLLLLSAIPGGIVGVLFEDIIEKYLRSSWVVVIMLIVISFVFFWVEKHVRITTELTKLNWKQALAIGFAQVLALIPGTSRSGVTISTGMTLGLSRSDAARFSFLMAIPLMAGATAKKSYDLTQISLSSHEIGLFLLGFIVSTVVGIIVIRFLLQFFGKYTLRSFAWYRLALAVVVMMTILL